MFAQRERQQAERREAQEPVKHDAKHSEREQLQSRVQEHLTDRLHELIIGERFHRWVIGAIGQVVDGRQVDCCVWQEIVRGLQSTDPCQQKIGGAYRRWQRRPPR
jgi:hypothetical protein